MEAFVIALSTITLAEMGDRTQLLSLVLATRFRQPLPILAGVLCAALVNSAVAALIGAWIGDRLNPAILDAAVGASMIVMAAWMLKPDSLEQQEQVRTRRGAFLTTLIAFFVAELGDKTQIATLALAAGYHSLVWVIAGSTCGLLIANAPVVFIGKLFADRLPLRAIQYAASALLIAIGVLFIVHAIHQR